MFLLYMSGGGFCSQTEFAADHESCLTERVDALLPALLESSIKGKLSDRCSMPANSGLISTSQVVVVSNQCY